MTAVFVATIGAFLLVVAAWMFSPSAGVAALGLGLLLAGLLVDFGDET